MRVDNKSVDTLIGNTQSTSISRAGQSSVSSAQIAGAAGGDHANLSSASNLVALAKNMIPADRQAKIGALASQVRAGQYRTDAPEASHAMVQELLQRT